MNNYRLRRLTKRHMLLVPLAVVLFLLSISFPALAQDATDQAPSGGFTVVSSAWFPGVAINGAFTELVRVVDFPPGTGTGLHTHGGPTLLSMMDGGSLTLRQDGVDKQYGPWESWMEMPDKVHEAFNDGNTTARVIASYLVPDGKQPAVPQGDPDRPAGKIVYEAQFPGITMDGMFVELVRVVDFPPGSGTGLHTHGGPTFILVTDGAFTLRQDGTDTTYKTGESWMEHPGKIHEAFNAGDKPAQCIAIYLLPMATPTTLVQS